MKGIMYNEKLKAAIKKAMPDADGIQIDKIVKAVTSVEIPVTLDHGVLQQQDGVPPLTLVGVESSDIITHVIGPNGYHQLRLTDGKGVVTASEWTLPSDIIRLGQYAAATDAFGSVLPQVSIVTPLQNEIDFQTETVQVIPNQNRRSGPVYLAD